MSLSDKIDVVMPTWNSGGSLFEITVKALLRTLGDKLHHFIVVDRFLSDNTWEILRKYVGEKLVVIQTEANPALARKIGLHFADTEGVVFMVDSDAVVNKRFLELGLLVLSKIRKVGVTAAPANDWIPLPNLSAYEDYSLSQHILRKGFYWVEIEPCARHLKEFRVRSQAERLLKQGLWEGSNARKVFTAITGFCKCNAQASIRYTK